MKIAIPLFGNRISPRFDCAQEFLIGVAVDGVVLERQELPAEGLSALARVGKLLELGVDTLICGGIDRISDQQLRRHGIRIYAWVTGEVEDALTCFLSGKLEPAIMVGSGGRCRGRWRFKGEPRGEGHGGRGKGRGKSKGQGRESRRGRGRY
jgi:predicted Fe-Mo cluster-binding NifX family protein